MLMVTTASAFANADYYRKMAQDLILQFPIILLFGVIDLMFGLYIVLTHSYWAFDWKVLITLFGWVLVIRGFVRLAFPGFVQKMAPKFLNPRYANLLGGVLFLFFLLGVFLTFKGFS